MFAVFWTDCWWWIVDDGMRCYCQAFQLNVGPRISPGCADWTLISRAFAVTWRHNAHRIRSLWEDLQPPRFEFGMVAKFPWMPPCFVRSDRIHVVVLSFIWDQRGREGTRMAANVHPFWFQYRFCNMLPSSEMLRISGPLTALLTPNKNSHFREATEMSTYVEERQRTPVRDVMA